ncbi:MAG: hypothetical protein KJ065_19285 [Anaerolineae bacterium]|nr:hypothetical protein [Anaerolineae bacterium]
MSEPIFKGVTITRDKVLRALEDFRALYPDDNAYEAWRESENYKYALEFGDRLYPPKYILSMITGISLKEFSGGEQTNQIFQRLGFRVTKKP